MLGRGLVSMVMMLLLPLGAASAQGIGAYPPGGSPSAPIGAYPPRGAPPPPPIGAYPSAPLEAAPPVEPGTGWAPPGPSVIEQRFDERMNRLREGQTIEEHQRSRNE